MTDEEALANAEMRQGKMPEAPWGFEIGPLAIPPNLHQQYADYHAKLHAWEKGAMAPVPTVGQFEDVTHLPGSTSSLPNQYDTRTSLEPSSVPRYGTQYQEGPKLGMTPPSTLPRYSDGEVLRNLNADGSNFLDISRQTQPQMPIQGPGAPSLTPPSMRNTPQPQLHANYQGVTGSLERPPVGGPFQPQQGPPQEIQRQELNRSKPINASQEDLYNTSLARQKSALYGRPAPGNAGVNTLHEKYAYAFDALREQHPDWPLEQLQAEAKAYVSGVKSLESIMENRKSMAENRVQRTQREMIKLGLSKEYQDAKIAHMKFIDEQAKAMSAKGMSPQDIALMRIQEQHQFHQMVVRAWMSQHMTDLPPEEKQNFEREMLGYLAGQDLKLNIEPPTQMGGMNVPFTGGKKSYTPTPQDRTKTPLGATPNPQETSQFSDAPPGNAVGDVLKSDGKPVARWDGHTWQPIQ